MPNLKDFKFDTSTYINLPPLGIRNAVIEECAKRAETGWGDIGPVVAADIRSLKTPTPE